MKNKIETLALALLMWWWDATDRLAIFLETRFTLHFAKVKYGEMIADMRGKINGTVHSKNRFGQYMRNKTSPVNPQTTSQSGVRNSFATFAQGWRSLTEAQRDAWSSTAENFTRNNVFGDNIKLTGANLYMSLNRNIATAAGTPITSPPLPAAVTGMLTLSGDPDVSDATIVMTYTPAVPASGTVLIFATAPQSAGVNFVKNKYRFIESIVAADVSPYDITAAYEAKFGTGWKVAGQKVFVKFVPMITLSGITAPGLESSSIVVA